MYLFKVIFELDRQNKITQCEEYICASEFKEVYEKVKHQQQENYDLIEIKRLVPIVSIIKPEPKEE